MVSFYYLPILKLNTQTSSCLIYFQLRGFCLLLPYFMSNHINVILTKFNGASIRLIKNFSPVKYHYYSAYEYDVLVMSHNISQVGN